MIGKGTLVFLLLLSTNGAPALATGSCLDAIETNEFFQSFQFLSWNDSQSQYVTEKIPAELCSNQTLLAKVLQSLHLLKNSPDLHQPSDDFNFNAINESPYSFFKRRISKIVFETNAHAPSCDKYTAAYVRSDESSTLHLCGYAATLSLLSLSSDLVHESRHTEGFYHTTCDHGFFKGAASCDDSYSQRGAYGVQTEFLVKVSRESSFGPVLRQEARANAILKLQERFNQWPLDVRTGALLQSENGAVSFYDGEKEESFLGGWSPSVMSLLGDVPTFFRARTGETTDYTFSKNLTNTDGTFAKAYREKYSEAYRQSFLDIFYSPAYGCQLFSDHLFCYGFNGEKNLNLSLRGIRPRQFVMSKHSSLIQEQTFYISGEDGSLFPLPQKAQDLLALTNEDSLIANKIFVNALSIVPWKNNQELIVFGDKRLMFYSSEGTWSSPPQTDGKKFKKALAPFVWSKKLEDL